MCLGCVALDSASTDYDWMVTVLTICGLQASEVAHVNPTWLDGTNLVIPAAWSCRCRSCALKARRKRAGAPWKPDLMRARVLDLSLLEGDGMRLWLLLRKRGTQVAQTTQRISQVARGMGMNWDGLSRWGAHCLKHRYGLSLETITKWHNRPTKLYHEPPFPGVTLAWDKLNKAYEGFREYSRPDPYVLSP